MADNHDVVIENEARSLTVVAEDTDTCRSDQPDADVDNNNIADNEQALYRARLGDVNAGEISNKVYIERNIVAAEAVLGLSDYSDGSEWAKVGVSEVLDILSLNNFVLVDDYGDVLSSDGAFSTNMLNLPQNERRLIGPVVLYKDSTNVCKAIVSESLGIVKIGISRLTVEENNLSHLCI